VSRPPGVGLLPLRTLGLLMAREARGQGRRLVFFIGCMAVGVAAVVAVAGLAESLDQAIRGEARSLLAADLAVSANQPPPAALATYLEDLEGSRQTQIREMVTVVAAPSTQRGVAGASRLVELKVIENSDYPYYGDLRLSPERPLVELLGEEQAVVGPELVEALGLEVGGVLNIGGSAFRVAGVVESEPDRLGAGFGNGPRLFLAPAGLVRAGLEGRGSRIRYRTLIQLPAQTSMEQLRRIAEELETLLGPLFQVESYDEAQPELRQGLRRAERFLGLVALLSLLIGGIGVAQTVRAWLAGRIDSIAILACLGLRPREVLALYVGQTVLLGIVGSLVGAGLGVGLMALVPHLLGSSIPPGSIDPWQPWAVGRGMALGLGCALLFSLAPLAAVLRVPPARVLRRDADPPPAPRWLRLTLALVLAFGLVAVAAAQSGSWAIGLQFTLGLAVATGVLALAARLLTALLARLPALGGVALRHGLAALVRPGSGALGAVVGLGLGVLVVLAMSLVEDRLSAQLETDLPRNAPSLFLIDIQPAQWEGVRRLLGDAGAETESVPVVMARFSKLDGKGLNELAEEIDENSSHLQRERRWALTREQRLTYLQELPADNEIVEGALWSDPQRAEVSIERDFAQSLNLKVGSTVELDIQGVALELTVTSLRTVDWESFRINFFMVVEPGVLDEAPQQRVAAVRLPAGEEQAVQDRLVASFPNVTPINIRRVLDKVLAVLRKVGLGVRLLGSFTVLAGIAILAGAISAGASRRGREVALLKTLGMTRLGVVTSFAVEYALVGLTAGTIGAFAGGVLAWGVITRGLELSWAPPAWQFPAAIALAALLAIVAGLAASLSALARRPIEVLRSE